MVMNCVGMKCNVDLIPRNMKIKRNFGLGCPLTQSQCPALSALALKMYCSELRATSSCYCDTFSMQDRTGLLIVTMFNNKRKLNLCKRYEKKFIFDEFSGQSCVLI